MDHTWGTSLLHTYRWATLAARVLDPGFLDGLRSIGAQIADIVGVPNLEPLPETPVALSKWCSTLRKNLEGPDFNLALDLAPQVTPDLAAELSSQAEQLRKLVGRGVRVPAPTRAIFEVASLLEQGPIALSEIYRVMRERRHLLDEGAVSSILSAGFWNDSIEDLFLGNLERKSTHLGRPETVRNAALSGLTQALVGGHMMLSGVYGADQSLDDYAELLPRIDSVFDFSGHPFLVLALVSYCGVDLFQSWLNGPVFQQDGYLAPCRPYWEWATRRPMITIASDL